MGFRDPKRSSRLVESNFARKEPRPHGRGIQLLDQFVELLEAYLLSKLGQDVALGPGDLAGCHRALRLAYEEYNQALLLQPASIVIGKA